MDWGCRGLCLRLWPHISHLGLLRNLSGKCTCHCNRHTWHWCRRFRDRNYCWADQRSLFLENRRFCEKVSIVHCLLYHTTYKGDNSSHVRVDVNQVGQVLGRIATLNAPRHHADKINLAHIALHRDKCKWKQIVDNPDFCYFSVFRSHLRKRTATISLASNCEFTPSCWCDAKLVVRQFAVMKNINDLVFAIGIG